ncbi:ABC transporter permease [Jeotgalibacillus salarius]|uniref:ABC transporter permease n=1 Tax=Jeotgalibacillus salarius TaxID=546023 RepID=A0A4Y8LLZ2_9BACL|nr:ABC transporter permease [Jeotgalibacillus salarius]TFE04024.1 ABC transporter permease [Jeotgalibacillus salarius]
MWMSIFTSVEVGLMFALMALGVYLSFRILDFPDLTVDGSFVTGAAVAAVMLVNGVNPLVAVAAAFAAGFIAGTITGLLHTVGGINPLLSGILMMIALYSINLRIMGAPNVSLLAQDHLFTWIRQGIGGTWAIMIVMVAVVLIVKVMLDFFLKTEFGLALRAVGDNHLMITSFSGNIHFYKVFGLGLSNGLVALAGALVAQYSGFADVNAGIGMIVIGLASVIIGEAIFGKKTIIRTTLAVIVGAIIYRIIVALALRVEFLETGDLKLITAIIVILALVLPKAIAKQKETMRKRQRRLRLSAQKG